MAVKRKKPVTPGQRFRVAPDYSELSQARAERALLEVRKRSGGRNQAGKCTMRYRGGGHKRRYRVVDFRRKIYDVAGRVERIEYDPNRTAFLALLHYANGLKRYILAPKGLKAGMEVVSGKGAVPLKAGNSLPLSAIPEGMSVHNVELRPGQGGKLVRSAGTAAQLMSKVGKHVILKMPSGEVRKVLDSCMATLGELSNADHMHERDGKAGLPRHRGRRPRTRPLAMNPVDHRMGGGEGRRNKTPYSRTGIYAQGQRTRKRGKHSDVLIMQRRKK